MQYMKPQALIKLLYSSVAFGSLLIPPSLNKINIAFLEIEHYATKRRIGIYHLVQNLSTHHLHSSSVYNYITCHFAKHNATHIQRNGEGSTKSVHSSLFGLTLS